MARVKRLKEESVKEVGMLLIDSSPNQHTTQQQTEGRQICATRTPPIYTPKIKPN